MFSEVLLFKLKKVFDWAAEMDRIGEQARLVLEQTEKEEDIDENIKNQNGVSINTKNIDIDIDDELEEEDLEAYKVVLEPTVDDIQVIDNANDLLNKLCINEEMKEEK